MNKFRSAFGAIAVTVAFLGGYAQAGEGLESCRVGQKVLSPGGKPGTVTKVERETACTVLQDDGTGEGVWSAFMLRAAPGSPAPAAKPISPMPTAGLYQCRGGPAGNLKLRFGPGNRYANEQGTAGAFTIANDGQISFTSGPWEGFFAKNLGKGKVGLTSRPNQSFYYMTCDIE